MNDKYKLNESFLTEEEEEHKNSLKYVGQLKNNLAQGYGKIVFSDNSNELIKYEGFFKNGLMDGYGKIFDNGKIVSEGYFYKGEEVAIVKLYNEEGFLQVESIKSTINFDGDNFIGKLYYKNGNTQYLGGIKFGSNLIVSDFVFNGKGKYYYENGQLCCEGNFEECQFVGNGEIFHKNGFIKERGYYGKNYSDFIADIIYNEGISALMDGYGEVFYDNGNICARGCFEHGLINGKCEKYYPNGNLMYKGSKIIIDANKSVYNGYGILYSENGRLKYKGDFKENKYNGIGKEYYENGMLKYEGEFKEGLKEGSGKSYNEEGVLVEKGEFHEYSEYENGNLDYSEAVYWDDGNETEDGFYEHE